MVKRAKVKPKVDYRHRWPTTQTLVDSRVSLTTLRSKWRWKFRVGWLRRLGRKSPPGPGKSTHPYDTGIGEESGSGPGSGPTSTLNDDGQGCWKLFTRVPQASSSPAPVPKLSHTKEEPRPETPRTPVQFLRYLTNPKKSPLPRPRTASSFDCDKPTVKCTKCTMQTPDLQPKATSAAAKHPSTPSRKFKSFMKNVFRRRSSDRRRAVRPLAGHSRRGRNLAPVRVGRLQ